MFLIACSKRVPETKGFPLIFLKFILIGCCSEKQDYRFYFCLFVFNLEELEAFLERGSTAFSKVSEAL